MTPDDELFLQTVLKLGIVTQSRADACIKDAATGAPVWEVFVQSGILRGSMVGRTLGGCLLVQKIGQGGMGEVYKARHVGLDKTVAVKILPPGDSESITRFLREARTLAKVEHPNIVGAHHVGEEQGVHFIVMQFIEGASLADRLKQGPIPAPEAARIGRDIARGLHAAHQAGVVHRDLKPGNVILSGGAVKVIDFGLAREAKADREITRAGDVVGSPHYMAPEQCTGRFVDARTDLYALGATLYHMLTGAPPFTGETLYEIFDSHVHTPPPDPRAKKPDVPAGLAGFVQRLLAKNPAERPEDAEVAARELDRYVSADAKASSTPIFSWPAIAGGLLGLALALVFVMQAVKRPRPQPKKPAAPAPALASLEIVTVPEGATIELDGKEIGKTPKLVENLEPREYAVTLRLADHEPASTKVRVDGKSRLSLGLKPHVKVELEFTSYGRRVRKSGLKLSLPERVPAGMHRIRIEHDQIETVEMDLDVRENGHKTIDLKAKPKWNGMVFVPPGKFLRGEKQEVAETGPFYIGEYEVTEGEYETFGKPRLWSGDPSMPVRSVTLQQASEYAKARGYRLPTADEWEKAARGEKGQTYPWGEKEPGERLKKPGRSEFDVSPYGARDMADSLREWTSDGLLKGGSYADGNHYLKAWTSQKVPENDTSAQNGFRCVAEYLPGLFED